MRSQLAVLIFLFIIIAALSATTSFFYTQRKMTQPSPTTSTPTANELFSATTTIPTENVSTVKIGSGPSSPSKTHQVAQGETLYPIGLKYDMDWMKIAEANGLTEPYKILEGQILIIPTVSSKALQIDYQINQETAQKLQTAVENGSQQSRLDPAETAKLDSPPGFGISKNDTFTLSGNDSGKAIVTVSHGEKSYQISLNQPLKPDGIWAITKITRK